MKMKNFRDCRKTIKNFSIEKYRLSWIKNKIWKNNLKNL